MNQKITLERVRFLDGLRGLLAFVVFVYHFLYAFNAPMLYGGDYQQFTGKGMYFEKFMTATPMNLLFNPGFAIHFFFILSGYVQSFQYFKNPDLNIIQKNVLKRYFRLAIPTCTVVLMVWLAHKFHLFHREWIPVQPPTKDWVRGAMPDSLSFLGALKHGLLDCFVQKASYYQVLWTMPIEIFNSFMVFILLFATHKAKHRMEIFLVLILVQIFLLDALNSVAFTIGVALCQAELNSFKFRRFFENPVVRYACLLAGLYLASFPYTGYAEASQYTMYKHISFVEKSRSLAPYLFGDTLLLLFLLRSPFLIRVFEKRAFVFLGDISFMLYLVHLLVLFTVTPLIFNKLLHGFSLSVTLWITFLSTTMVVLVLSYLLYRFVDVPVLKACSRFVKRQFSGVLTVAKAG